MTYIFDIPNSDPAWSAVVESIRSIEYVDENSCIVEVTNDGTPGRHTLPFSKTQVENWLVNNAGYTKITFP